MSMNPKSPLEIAASSPDPLVRGFAVRRIQIDKELANLDQFLSFYASQAEVTPARQLVASTANGAQPAKRRGRPRKEVAAVAPNGRGTGGKGQRMVEASVAIIIATAQPMTLANLFERLREEHPDLCPANDRSLRSRLNDFKHQLVRIDKRGFWPVGVEVPEWPTDDDYVMTPENGEGTDAQAAV